MTTATVNPGGGADYLSLSLAEAGEEADFVTRTDGAIINCDTDGTADTTATVIDGSTTDASYFMTIQVLQANRPPGGVYTTASYHLDIASGHAVDFKDPFIECYGIQIDGNNTNGTNYVIRSNDIVIAYCLSKAAGDDGFYGQGQTVYNCLAFDCNDEGFFSNLICKNCSSIDNGGDGFNSSAALTNCLAHGNAGADFGAAASCTTCASEDATADDHTGSGNRVSQTFTFVDYGGDDFDLAAGDAGAIDYGTDLSGEFTDDLAGDTRGATFDIGCFEYIAPAAGGLPAGSLGLLGVGI